MGFDYERFFAFSLDADSTKARCKYCDKWVGFSRSSKTNLQTHLKKYHESVYESVVNYNAVKNGQNFSPYSSNAEYNEYRKNETITDSLVNNIFVKGGISPLILETSWFRTFLGDLDKKYVIPNLHSIFDRIGSMASADYSRNMFKFFDQEVSFHVDVWPQGYLSILCSRITGGVSNLNTQLLCFKRDFGELNQFFSDLCIPFSISSSYVEILNKALSSLDYGSTYYLSNPLFSSPLQTLDLQSVEHFKPNLQGCPAHILQLLLSEALRQHSESLTIILMQAHNTTLFTMGDWNHALHILDIYLSQNKDELNCDDQILLESIISILNLFEEATSLLQREPSVHLLIPTLQMLERALRSLARNSVVENFCHDLLNRLEARFGFVRGSDIHILATFLDPSVKVSFTENHEDNIIFAFDADECITIASNFISQKFPIVVKQECTNYHGDEIIVEKKKRLSLFDFKGHSAQTVSTGDTSCLNQFTSYVHSPLVAADIISFWGSQNALLSSLARGILSTSPATSAVEKLFNTALPLLSARCQPPPYIMEHLLRLSVNSK